MKRFLLSLLALAFCGIGSLLADENVRALQSKLKEGGFYFGEVTGTYGSDTAAALTRYQIRNGLPISGQLDAETAKALGVSAPKGSFASADAATWRDLRKTDQQFLTKMNAGKTAPPATAQPTRAASAAPGSTPLASPSAPYSATFTLSRERLRDFVAGFVVAGLQPQIGAELEFFADRVNYFDSGMVDHERIRKDLQSYDNRWPQRRFWLAGEIQVEPPQSDGRLRVTFPLRYELRNQAKRKSGRVKKILVLEVNGDDLQIVGVNERKA